MKMPNSDTIIDALVTGGGVTTGGMLSKGVNAFLPEDEKAADGTVVSKKNSRIGIKAATALTGLAGLIFLPNDGLAATAGKAASAGVFGESVISIVTELAKGTDIDSPATSEEKGKLFVKAALGLKGSCGCNSAPQTFIPEFKMPAMRMPSFDEPIPMYQEQNGVFTAA